MRPPDITQRRAVVMRSILSGFAAVALAGAGLAAGQFVFPTGSTRLNAREQCTIRWNTDGLQAPLSINLVPGGVDGANGGGGGNAVTEKIAGMTFLSFSHTYLTNEALCVLLPRYGES